MKSRLYFINIIVRKIKIWMLNHFLVWFRMHVVKNKIFPFFFIPNYDCNGISFSLNYPNQVYIFKINYKILLSSGVMENLLFFFNYFLNLKYKVLFCILLVKLYPLVREQYNFSTWPSARLTRAPFLPYSSAINWILNCSFGKNNNLMNLIDNK